MLHNYLVELRNMYDNTYHYHTLVATDLQQAERLARRLCGMLPGLGEVHTVKTIHDPEE